MIVMIILIGAIPLLFAIIFALIVVGPSEIPTMNKEELERNRDEARRNHKPTCAVVWQYQHILDMPPGSFHIGSAEAVRCSCNPVDFKKIKEMLNVSEFKGDEF